VIRIKKFLNRLVKVVSLSAVHALKNSNRDFRTIWDLSLKHFPSFADHFSFRITDPETEARIRFLVVVETLFIKESIGCIKKDSLTYADIGDSDGAVRILLTELFSSKELDTIGVNLQPSAVEKMRKLGLKAICADAMELGKQNVAYDVVSVFETLEHLPDPIGFLTNIKPIVNERLVLSVPFIRKSKIGLRYLDSGWPEGQTPTIENQHIFELSPLDWKKIILHAGWAPRREKIFKQFPENTYHRFILQPYWRYISFEGFWFVELEKNDTYSSQYSIE
jgi:hypothetical protein